MSLKQRLYWLLAQVGFWAGEWVGRRNAREAEANHRAMLKPEPYLKYVRSRHRL